MEGESCNVCGAPTVIDYGIGAGADAQPKTQEVTLLGLPKNGAVVMILQSVYSCLVPPLYSVSPFIARVHTNCKSLSVII